MFRVVSGEGEKMGRQTSEMFRAVSSRREDRREGQFHKCFGQFPGMEDRGEESFRHVSGSPRGDRG